MNLDLTAQFLRDFEDLRARVENPPEPIASPDEIRALQQEVERLKAVIREMEGRLLKEADQQQASLDKLHEEFAKRVKEIELTYAGRLKALELSHAGQFAAKAKEYEEALAEQAGRDQQAREAIKAEYVKKARALVEEAKQKIAAERREMNRVLNVRLVSMRAQVLSEFEGGLDRLAYVPLGMRISSLVLDLSLLALAAAALRLGLRWGEDLSRQVLILTMAVAFSMRTFVSPANILLGISARRIGPDHRPEGRVRFRTRLICGLLHYGPLIATVIAVMGEWTETFPKTPVVWASDLGSNVRTLTKLAVEVLGFESSWLPIAILVFSLAWWALLVLSVLFTSVFFRSRPYFRNTTLVEYRERVGFQRFSPPALKSSDPDVLQISG